MDAPAASAQHLGQLTGHRRHNGQLQLPEGLPEIVFEVELLQVDPGVPHIAEQPAELPRLVGIRTVTSAYAADAGVWCLRVHDVVATVDALDVWAAWRGSEGAGA